MEGATKTQVWRACLFILALFNVGVYVTLILRDDGTCRVADPEQVPTQGLGKNAYTKTMLLLAFPYVFQTTWRCLFISEYPNRRTITDHPLNSVLVARLLAALGEFCFGVQLALGLYTACAPVAVLPPATLWTCVVCIIVLDGIGQCCATYGTIVGSNLPFLLEGILWSGIFGISLTLASTSAASVVLASYRGVFLWAVIVLTIPGLLYMLCGYCPLCWDAWREEVALRGSPGLLKSEQAPPSFRSKAWEALTLRVPTKEWKVWAHECVWQSLYFSIGTWSSLGLIAFPLHAAAQVAM